MQHKIDIIAEIGTAHGGNIEKARALIEAAAEAGADSIKFQWVYADEILHPETGFVNLPGGKTRLYDRFRALEVSADFFAECAKIVHERKKKFVCSPFGIKSLRALIELKPDAIKIASPELNHIPLLTELSEIRKNVPISVIVSTGVSRLFDIEKALEILGTKDVTLLHCITSYPAPEDEYNLRVIPNLSQIFGVPCGVSDHSLDPVLVPSLCAAVGGRMIEKHITLSRKDSGLDDPVALESEQFSLMVHAVRQCEACFRQYGEGASEYIKRELSSEYGERIEKILGSGIKTLAPSEKENYRRTNRSLHFLREMKSGETIKNEDIGVLRTEKMLSVGLHPLFLPEIAGAKLVKDAKNGEGVTWAHFIQK